MGGSPSRAQKLPNPPKYLHTLLTATEDTHKARANVFYTYDSIFLLALEYKDDEDDLHNIAVSVWTNDLRGRFSTPSNIFDQIWQGTCSCTNFTWDILISYTYTQN